MSISWKARWAILLAISIPGVALAQGQTVKVEGLVLDSSARALPGVKIVATAELEERSATSDVNGYFDLGDFPSGELSFFARLPGDVHANKSFLLDPGRAFLVVNPSGGGSIEERGSSISGTVRGELGARSDVPITVRLLATHLEWNTTATTWGRFQFEPLPAGTYVIQAQVDDRATTMTLDLGWMSSVDVEIGPEGRITERMGSVDGVIYDLPQRGAAQIDITEVRTGETFSISSNEDGRFRGDDKISGGMYHVRVEQAGELVQEARILLRPDVFLEVSRDGIFWGGSEEEAEPPEFEPTHTPGPKPNYTVVDVFYGTDRGATESSEPSEMYESKRDSLKLGTAKVSIPKDHRVGELEEPSIWRLEFREDPDKHVVLLSVTEKPEEEFINSLRATVQRSSAKAAFVFVHGYNVTFKNAVRRTGQMAYDLQFDGAPILYSWPSKGSTGGYIADEATVQATLPHLKEFLTLVVGRSGAGSIHLVAHSMGNRALTTALQQFAADHPGPTFSQIALVAPDIDAQVFKRDIAPRISEAGQRVTLYASNNDNALNAAALVYDAPRAGNAGDDLVVLSGIDTIDVSELDTSLIGHSYYAENRSVISDLFYLFKNGMPPGERFGLQERQIDGLIYWRFVP